MNICRVYCAFFGPFESQFFCASLCRHSLVNGPPKNRLLNVFAESSDRSNEGESRFPYFVCAFS